MILPHQKLKVNIFLQIIHFCPNENVIAPKLNKNAKSPLLCFVYFFLQKIFIYAPTVRQVFFSRRDKIILTYYNEPKGKGRMKNKSKNNNESPLVFTENDAKAEEELIEGNENCAKLTLSERAALLWDKLKEAPERLASLWRTHRTGAKRHAKEGLVGAALGLCGYLLGACALPFGVYPLGLALLCAAPQRIAWILVGLCASALSLGDAAFIYIFAYATAITVRLLSKLLSEPAGDQSPAPLFTESIYLRMATAEVAAFMIGLYNVIINGFQYYHLWGTAVAMIAAPVATFVYSGCFVKDNRRFFDLALTALFASISYSIRDMYFIGISAGVFFTFFIALFVCRRRGIWQGAVVGLLTGLAYSPAYAPVFVIAPIAAGALWSISAVGAVVAAGAAGMIWGFYVEGVGAMSRLLPAMILASACYLWAQKLSFFPAARDLLFSGRYCADMNRALIDRESKSKTEDRLSSLSDAFSSLSDIFYNLSERLCRPGVPELERMCDGVYDRYCPSCPNREICWGIEYSESRELLSMLSERLSSEGAADVSDLPDYMRRRCQALPGIIGEINERSAELFRMASSSEKTEIFAMDYASISDILRDAEEESRIENEPDDELRDRLSELFSEYGFGEGGVSVYGKRLRRIVARGFDISSAGIGMKELKARVEEICGFPVSEPTIEIKEGFLTLRMSSARTCRAVSVSRVENVGREECGDTVATFENCEDRLYALISDGMGKGRAAAFTSGVSSMFVKKMLGAGNRVPTVIKMLNSFVRSKPEECSATLDLMELDLLSGRVEFYKCGAAATYVKRGDNLFKLAAETVPLGILKATDAAKLSFDAQAGDAIVMMSDGIAQGEDDCLWLIELLSKEWDPSGEAMAKKIIAAAREHGSDDDASVVIVKVAAQ